MDVWRSTLSWKVFFLLLNRARWLVWLRKVQEEKQGDKEALTDKNPQLPHDSAQKVHPVRQKDIGPHKVPHRAGHQENHGGSLRLDKIQSFISYRAQGRQEHEGPLLLLHPQNQERLDVLQRWACSASWRRRSARKGCVYVFVWESQVRKQERRACWFKLGRWGNEVVEDICLRKLINGSLINGLNWLDFIFPYSV